MKEEGRERGRGKRTFPLFGWAEVVGNKIKGSSFPPNPLFPFISNREKKETECLHYVIIKNGSTLSIICFKFSLIL